MFIKGSKKNPGLFVVKGSDAPKRILGADALSPEQKNYVKKYLSLSGTEGILVGAVQGNGTWDLRPLILIGNRTFILRISDPRLSMYVDLQLKLRGLFVTLDGEKLSDANFSVGFADELTWVRRVFFDQTLSDLLTEDFSTFPVKREAFAQALVSELSRLHQRGIVHGHICPSNIAIMDGLPCLFDFGFLSASPTYSAADSAPEIQGGAFASTASDVYGLALVLRHILPSPVHPNVALLIERMTHSDPSSRATMEEVANVLIPGYAARNISVSQGSTIIPSAPIPSIPSVRDQLTEQAPAYSEVNKNAHLIQPVQQNAQIQQKKMTGLYVLFALVTLAILVMAGFGFWKALVPNAANRRAEYQGYWDSGQPSLMKEVAGAAIDDQDRLAQTVIINSTISNKTKIVSDLFKVAFDPRWEEQLGEQDREVILKIGLERMLGYQFSDLPTLGSLHPGVILALTSNLNLESKGHQFEQIPVSRMATLPDDIGAAFKALEVQQVVNMEDLSARALSHILVGDTSPITFAAFFASCGEAPVCLARLAVLVPIAQKVPDFSVQLLSRLPTVAPQLMPLLSWFSEDDIAKWNSVANGQKLELLVGNLPKKDLKFEQYVDLLRFPLSSVRSAAVDKLVADFPYGPEMKGFITVLSEASKDQKLNRAQNLSLLSAVLVKGDPGFSFISKWFETLPDSHIVLRLLLARTYLGEMDPFSLEACRYLAKQDWQASVEELEQLAQHSESFARALAYNKLRIEDPRHLEILRRMSEKESNERNRKLLQGRLEAAAIISKQVQ